MKTATIFAIIGVIVQLVWSLTSGVLTQLPDINLNYKIIQNGWLVVGLFSSITLLAFFITFLSHYDKINKRDF